MTVTCEIMNASQFLRHRAAVVYQIHTVMRYIFCKSHKVDRLLMLQLENLCEKAFLMCLIVIP